MTTSHTPDPDEHFEKVAEGVGPEQKTSYAPTDSDDAKQRAEEVRHKVREDRDREDPSSGSEDEGAAEG
jgi:hypothetical protein